MYKKIIFLNISLIILLTGCNTLSAYKDIQPDIPVYQDIQPDINEIINTAKEAAEMFYYYPELESYENIFVGSSEIGGQCNDYALAFVNIWNEKYPGQARLVIQNQKWSNGNFPDGIYRVIRKINEDDMSSSFRKWIRKETTSKLFYWTVNFTKILGIWHPIIGIYEVRLSGKLNITHHFGIELKNNHVWAVVGNLHIDPQWGDSSGEDYLVTYNTW